MYLGGYVAFPEKEALSIESKGEITLMEFGYAFEYLPFTDNMGDAIKKRLFSNKSSVCSRLLGAPASLKLRYLTRYNTDSQMLSAALALHWSFLVNSWCHTHTADDACKRGPCEGLMIPWVGLLSGGEGFHFGSGRTSTRRLQGHP